MNSFFSARCFLTEAARTPMNLLTLVLVPVVFVLVASGALADAAESVTGPDSPAVPTASAGWSAGFVAAVAMYFQTRAARAADRRLVLAGLPPSRLVAARMMAGLALASLASTAALLALAVRTGTGSQGRAVAGTLLFALIYLAIGALAGVLVRNPVNGTVLVLFIWIIDVFFGPAMSGTEHPETRALPTYFVTLWMTGLPAGYTGPAGGLGWALVWAVLALAASWTVIAVTSRAAGTARTGGRPGAGQTRTGVRLGLREAARNHVLWVLLLVVPAVFVLFAQYLTEDGWTTITVREGGSSLSRDFWLPDVHGGLMAPMAVASLAALTGMFVVLNARAGDRRLALAGFRTGSLLVARLTVVVLGALAAAAAALVTTAAVFDAEQWVPYLAGNVLVAVTYALLGVLLGPLFGRVGGVLIAFMVPFLDVGIAQSPMLRPEPADWAVALPGYGATRVLTDGALTAGFDETGPLLLALAWPAVLALAAAGVFRATARPSGRGRGG